MPTWTISGVAALELTVECGEVSHLNTDVGTRIFASWLPESAYVLPGE